MSGPLPLRLCCMAAMAPALTEAATQAKIKLPESSSAASSDSVNGRDLRHSHAKSEKLSRNKLTKVVAGPLGGLATSVPVSHLNGDPLRSSQKPGTALAKLGSITVSANIKDLLANRGNAFQHEFIKSFGPNGKRGQRMNQPSPLGPGNEEAEKCHKQSAQNGSRLQIEDGGRTETGNAKGRQTSDRVGGQAVNLLRSTRTMCRNTEEGDKSAPGINKSSAGSTLWSAPPPTPRLPSLITTMASSSSNTQTVVVESSVDIDCIEVRQGRAEASKKQAQLERKAEFLLRRLRRVEGHQMESHVRLQLAHFIEYQRNNLQTVAKTISPSASLGDNSGDLKAELISDEVKNLSTAALVSLVRRLQATQSVPHHQPTVKPEVTNVLTMDRDVRRESKATAEKLQMNLNFMQSALDSDATESSSGGESGDDEDLDVDHPPPATPLMRRAEWKWGLERAAVASRWTWLQAQVSDLEYRIRQQSDIYKQVRHTKGPVTLGEPPLPQDLLRVTSHIANRTVLDSRLTASIVTTGSVGMTEVSPCNVSAVLSNVDKQANRLTQSLGNCLSPVTTSPASSVSSSHAKSGVSSPVPAPNGLIDSPLSTASGEVDPTGSSSFGGQSKDNRSGVESMDLSPVLDVTCRAARCLPLKHPLRKRKLLRTSGLHLLSRKAARLSTVKCHCYPPVTPCVVCGGRPNSVQTVDADSMPFHERVALLDPSFHQVLSFPEEVPLSVHFEALLKSGDWQIKPPVRRQRAEYRRQRCLTNTTDGRKNSRQFRKNAASVIISSAKIRSKYENKAGRKRGPQPGKRLGKRAMNAELKRRRQAQIMGLVRKVKGSSDSYMGNFDTPAASPLSRDSMPGSCPNSGIKEKEVRKRRGESAYDINNIVIPYSMASATRVEKLPYKEIVTPKWRDLTDETAPPDAVDPDPPTKEDDLPNGLDVLVAPQDSEETEDLTDESFAARHKLCEADEKKRFSTFVQYPITRRHRSRSEISAHSLDSSAHDLPLPLPATPDGPCPPVSMGTQASLDVCGESLGEDWQEEMGGGGMGRPYTPLPSLLAQFRDEDSNSCLGVGWSVGGSLRRGSMSMSNRERLSLGSSVDDGEAEPMRGRGMDPWPPRTFPLSDEDVVQLTAEQWQEQQQNEQSYSLRPVPAKTLGVFASGGVAVEAMSRAESSASGSQPGSPLASSTSMSAVGECDPGDPEWLADNELMKKPGKLTKR